MNITIGRVVKVMVEKYPDCLQYTDIRKSTAFLTACGYGHAHLVEHLITEHNADYQGDPLYGSLLSFSAHECLAILLHCILFAGLWIRYGL